MSGSWSRKNYLTSLFLGFALITGCGTCTVKCGQAAFGDGHKDTTTLEHQKNEPIPTFE